MQKRSFLRHIAAVTTFCALPLAFGCAGKIVSLGSTNEQLSSVDPATVTGTIGACPSGYAHPNVCCSGGPSEQSACGAYVQHPFTACPAGAITYPNPLTCCSLADGTTCVDTPSTGAPMPPSYGCGYSCPPGWWPNNAPYPVPVTTTPNGGTSSSGGGSADGTNSSGSSSGSTGSGGGTAVPPSDPGYGGSGSCCRTNPDGSGECFGWASSAPSRTTVGTDCADGGVIIPVTDDAGIDTLDGGSAPKPGTDPSGAPSAGGSSGGSDPSTGANGGDCAPPPDAYDGGAFGLCTPCPDGWKADPASPDLCCTIDPNGDKQCFSQATGPIGGGGGYPGGGDPPTATDAGAPSSPTACSGTDTQCSCKQDDGTTAYMVTCEVTDTGSTCTCTTQDGTTTSEQAPLTFASNMCSGSPDLIITVCKTH